MACCAANWTSRQICVMSLPLLAFLPEPLIWAKAKLVTNDVARMCLGIIKIYISAVAVLDNTSKSDYKARRDSVTLNLGKHELS